MKVFVTGGTGFIGKNTVTRLVESGHQCVCLIRNPQKQAVLNDLSVQFATGDVTNKQSLIEGMNGCDALINLANVFSLWERIHPSKKNKHRWHQKRNGGCTASENSKGRARELNRYVGAFA